MQADGPEQTRLKFTDPRGPYGLSSWWWLFFLIWLLLVAGMIVGIIDDM